DVISVTKAIAVSGQFETIAFEIPENRRGGLSSEIAIEAYTYSSNTGEISFSLAIDNLRLQYDLAGNVQIIDSFGDSVTGLFDEEMIAGYKLDQNYPNPFNPTTTIGFELSREEKISLKIYDLRGEEVAVLISDGEKPAGKYRVAFNATNFASGTYVYVLKAGNREFSNKMILMK